MTDTAIACAVMRGGTSKGAFFLANDLPSDPAARDELLLRIVGSPDPRQIDGIGGAHPLTTKVAIISRSNHDRADVDYLFLQPSVDEAVVSDAQNCGNLLAAVGQFALSRGLIDADGAADGVRILMVNTDSVAVSRFPVIDGNPGFDGDVAIAGVPGTAAPVRLEFLDIAGSSCGALLPTGRPVDEIDGVACTLIDNGMPAVVMAASDFGVACTESPTELEANQELRDRIESIRRQAGPLMRLGDVEAKSVPKMTLVAPPAHGGDLATRSFIPHRCHDAIGVLAAVTVATAALLPDTPAAAAYAASGRVGAERSGEVTLGLEHPTGVFDTVLRTDDDGTILGAGIVRTARLLMDGRVFPRPRS